MPVRQHYLYYIILFSLIRVLLVRVKLLDVSLVSFLRCCLFGGLPSPFQQCWWSLWVFTWSCWGSGCGSDTASRLVLLTVSQQRLCKEEGVYIGTLKQASGGMWKTSVEIAMKSHFLANFITYMTVVGLIISFFLSFHWKLLKILMTHPSFWGALLLIKVFFTFWILVEMIWNGGCCLSVNLPVKRCKNDSFWSFHWYFFNRVTLYLLM